MPSDPLHRRSRRRQGLPRCPHHLRRPSPGYGQSVGSQIQLQHDRRAASGHHQAVRSIFHHPLDAVFRAGRGAPNFSRPAGHGRSQAVRCAVVAKGGPPLSRRQRQGRRSPHRGNQGHFGKLAAARRPVRLGGPGTRVHWAHRFVDSRLGHGRRHGPKSQRSRKNTVQAGDRGRGREQRRDGRIPGRE